VRVVEFGVEDVEDLYAARAFLEGMTARYAASAITREEIRELTSLHERMVHQVDPEQLRDYRELNRRFHTLIFNASRRSYLIRSLGQIWAAFPTMLWSNVPHAARESAPGREKDDAVEHEAIVSALAAHDPDAAERAVRRHIEAAATALVTVLKEER
jgi:DNA-binding GntR family transcriptional regulator